MYIGATISLAVCIYIVYVITSSGNTNIEWIVWVFLGISITLIVSGFSQEREYKRKHGYLESSKFEDIFKEEQ